MNFIHYLFEISFFISSFCILYQIYKAKETCCLLIILLLFFIITFLICITIPLDSQPHHLMIYLTLTIPFLFSLFIGILYVKKITGENINVNL